MAEEVYGGYGFTLPTSTGFAPRAVQGSRVAFISERGSIAFVQTGRAFETAADLAHYVHDVAEGCSQPQPLAVGGLRGLVNSCVEPGADASSTRELRMWSGFRPELQWIVACSADWPSVSECDRFMAALELDPALRPQGLDGIEVSSVDYVGPEDVPRFAVDIDGAPGRGADEPLVTIVMFSDFECPFCARAAPVMEQLLRKYPNELRVVYKQLPLPFHKRAKLAAEASLEAQRQGGNAGFFAYHDALFAHQKELSAERLSSIAGELGMDVKAFEAALQDHRHAARVEADMRLASRLEARGTPTFFINGQVFRGAQSLAKFEEWVEAARHAARKTVMLGVPRKDLYALAMRDARTEGIPSEKEVQPEPDVVYKVPVQGAPSHGPADALVTMVEITDFECPFCKRASSTVKELEGRYGKDLRVVVLNNPLPFHESAALAAEASLEAFKQKGSEGYFKYYDALFANAPEHLSREDLERIATEQGLDLAAFKRALDKGVHKKRVAADASLASKLGASGTPSFFINGRRLRGAQPATAFIELIDRELAAARHMVDAGTPKAKVYATIQKNGVEAAPGKALEAYKIAAVPDAPSQGPAKAAVTVVQFTDFQCPFCARVLPTLEALRKKYPKQVRFVLRNYPLPFHQQAFLAAEAAHEVFVQLGDEAFWKYHDVLFAHQDALGADDLLRYAADLGKVDMDRFRRALDERTHRGRVQADIDVVESSGAKIGTPSFFVNGYLVQGAQPIDRFAEVIDRALQESRKR